MGEARHKVFVTGLRGIVLDGEVRGLPVDSVLDEGQVVGLHLDADRVEALDECGFDGGARPGERVEHGAAGWGDEPDQPTHNREGLHRRVLYTVNVRAFTLRSLRRVEEPGCAALVGVASPI